jgi:hypothetical protein
MDSIKNKIIEKKQMPKIKSKCANLKVTYMIGKIVV